LEVGLGISVPFMDSIASLAKRFRSAAFVYLETSRDVVWPLIALICSSEHPASARRRHIAFRKPCALRPRGSPASRHKAPNQFVKAPGAKGLPVDVVRNVK
jgi:hypothetical protein